MTTLLLADLVIQIKHKYGYIRKHGKKYIYDGDRPVDIFIEITQDDIENERKMAEANYFDNYLEFICCYRKIAEKLLDFDAFVMHGTAIEVENKGIIFTALREPVKPHICFTGKKC